MKLTVLVFGLILLIGTASATVSYSSDTIWLDSGTNTLSSMYSDVGGAGILEHSAGTYTLYKNISGVASTTAHLTIENANLVIDGSLYQVQIKTFSDLIIDNMTISVSDYANPYLIYGTTSSTNYMFDARDTTFIGGRVRIQPVSFQEPRTPTIVRDCILKNLTLVLAQDNVYGLGLLYDASVNVDLDNLLFQNISLTGTTSPGSGIVYLNGYDDGRMDNITWDDCSVSPQGGMIRWYGGNPSSNPFIIDDFVIQDITGSGGEGISSKEAGNIYVRNGTISNTSGDAVRMYYSISGSNYVSWWLENIVIDDCSDAISTVGNDNVTAYIYNVSVNNPSGYVFRIYGHSDFNTMNFKATNYGGNYIYRSGVAPEIRMYELLDVYVKDISNDPVYNAAISILPVGTNASNADGVGCVNQSFTYHNETNTLINGHTQRPNESLSETLALMRYQETAGFTNIYSYNITATKDGNSSIKTVNPNSTYYRSDVNIPIVTTVISLNVAGWSYDSSHTYTNVKYRYYTNGTRAIVGRDPLETDTDMGDNSTIPWPVVS